MSGQIASGGGPQMAKIRQQAGIADWQHIKYAVPNCSFSFNDYPSNSDVKILTIFSEAKEGGNIHGTD